MLAVAIHLIIHTAVGTDMRLVEIVRLICRMLVFGVSTAFFWAGFEFDVLCLRRIRLNAINKWVPLWSRFNLTVFGVDVLAHGKYLDEGRPYPGGEPGGKGHIFIANHQSGMDIPILFTIAETHVISRHDLASWPLLGRAARRIGTLFVDRDSKRSGASVLRAVDQALQRGEGVAMFPEGTAHDGDQVHEFRPGAFNAARRSGAEIIPIGLAYGDATAYYAGQSFLKHMTRIACQRGMRVAVEVGEPIQLGENTVIETKNLARQRVQELADRAQARLG